MTGILEYFSNLRENIRNARSKKALRVLQKHGIKFMKELSSNSNIKPEIKSGVRRELSKTIQLIIEQEKQIN